MTTLATRYKVTRDAESEYPELAAQGNIISEDPQSDSVYELCVWGNGASLEQTLNEASSVVEYKEIGSVIADLDEIKDAITDSNYKAWVNSHESHDGSPMRTLMAMAKDLCEEFVLNTIESASGVVDITADVVADAKGEE